MLKWIPVLLLLAACGLTPSEDRVFNPDEEFAKLDGPDVTTVQGSLERAALEALTKGDYKRSIGLYEQLIDYDQKEKRYKLGMAEALRRIGEYKAAVAFYDMVTQLDPQNIDAYEGKALAMMANGDTEEAAKLFQSILKRDRTRWRTLNALGILFAMNNMPQEATAYLKEGLRVSNNNPSILNNLGLIEATQHRYTSSIENLQKAARQADAGQKMQIELNQALVYGISGDIDRAEAMAARHLDEYAVQNNMGLYAHLSNDRELAKSYLNMALAGTNVYYKRAWENLDIIAKEGDEKSNKPARRIKVQ